MRALREEVVLELLKAALSLGFSLNVCVHTCQKFVAFQKKLANLERWLEAVLLLRRPPNVTQLGDSGDSEKLLEDGRKRHTASWRTSSRRCKLSSRSAAVSAQLTANLLIV